MKAVRSFVFVTALAAAVLVTGCKSPSGQQEQVDRDFRMLTLRLDAAIENTRTPWTPPDAIVADMRRAAGDMGINVNGCAAEFCRFSITLRDRRSLEAFAGHLVIHGVVIFDYPIERPLTVVAYVFKPGTDMRSL